MLSEIFFYSLHGPVLQFHFSILDHDLSDPLVGIAVGCGIAGHLCGAVRKLQSTRTLDMQEVPVYVVFKPSDFKIFIF